MDLHPLKIDTSQHNLKALCIKDCNPALNHDFKCIGLCFQFCPLLCKTLSLQQDFLPPPIPPIIPPFILHPSPPVTETGDIITQTNMILRTSMIILASLVALSILICIFFCFLRFRYFLKQRRERRERRERIRPVFFGTQEDFIDEDRGPGTDHHIWYINTIGLQQSAIDLIAVFTYKKDELVIEGTECSVCLSEFEENESLKLLPKCSHAFHIPCIDTWLRSHKNCPLCRAPIVSDDFDAQRDLGENSDISSDGVIMSLQIREEETSEPRNEDDPECPFQEDEQTLRRSVSLDSSSAMAIRDAFDVWLEHLKSKNVCKRPRNGSLSFRKVMKISSIGHMLHKGPITLKRSFSNIVKSSSSSSSSSGHSKTHGSSSLVLPL